MSTIHDTDGAINYNDMRRYVCPACHAKLPLHRIYIIKLATRKWTTVCDSCMPRKLSQ